MVICQWIGSIHIYGDICRTLEGGGEFGSLDLFSFWLMGNILCESSGLVLGTNVCLSRVAKFNISNSILQNTGKIFWID